MNNPTLPGRNELTNITIGDYVKAEWVLARVAGNESSLVAWWKGDDNSIDSVNGNDASWVGYRPATYSTGIVDKCFDMTSNYPVGSHIVLPFSNDYKFNSESKFTIEFYFKTPSSSVILFQRDSFGGGTDFLFQIDTGIFNITTSTTIVFNCSWVQNTWYKLRVNYNSGKWRVFLNGTEQLPQEENELLINTNLTEGFIVNKSNSELLIDELKIYDDNELITTQYEINTEGDNGGTWTSGSISISLFDATVTQEFTTDINTSLGLLFNKLIAATGVISISGSGSLWCIVIRKNAGIPFITIDYSLRIGTFELYLPYCHVNNNPSHVVTINTPGTYDIILKATNSVEATSIKTISNAIVQMNLKYGVMIIGAGLTVDLTDEANFGLDAIYWKRNSIFTGNPAFYDLSAYALHCNGFTFWVLGGYYNGTNCLFYSSDGINFNSCNDTGLLRYVNSITYKNGRWVAVGVGFDYLTSSAIIYSDDGINWSTTNFFFPSESTPGNDTFLRVSNNKTMFLAGGYSGDGLHNLAYSYDGINWFDVLNLFGVGFEGWAAIDMSWNGSKWMAVTGDYGVIALSSDGINWTQKYTVPDMDAPISIANNGTRWVVVGNIYPSSSHANTIAYSDDDGDTWTNLGRDIIDIGYYPQIVYDGTRFILTNQEGNPSDITVAYSNDGAIWTSLGNSICSSWNQAIGVGAVADGYTMLVQWFKLEDNLDDYFRGQSMMNWSSEIETYGPAFVNNGLTYISYGVISPYFYNFRAIEFYFKTPLVSTDLLIVDFLMQLPEWVYIDFYVHYTGGCFKITKTDGTPVDLFTSDPFDLDVDSWYQMKFEFNGVSGWSLYVSNTYDSYVKLTPTLVKLSHSSIYLINFYVDQVYSGMDAIQSLDEIKVYGTDLSVNVGFSAYNDYGTHVTGSGWAYGPYVDPDFSIWDWGDGETSTGISSDHTYVSTGVYSVTLSVKIVLTGETSKFTQDVYVYG